MSIVLECRVTDSLMQHGRNNGKKMMAVRIIKHSFEIIHLLTDQNPIQVLVDAIINRCRLAFCASTQLCVTVPGLHRKRQARQHECSLSLREAAVLITPQYCLLLLCCRSGPREDATRIGSAGVIRRQAVDISPLRRVNQAIYLLTTGARESAFRNIKTISECLADELINAAKGSSNS